MKNEYVDVIKNDKNYIELLARRRRLTLILTTLMLIVYFSFILSIAFNPSFLAQPLCPESIITLGIPVGIFVIVFAFILTGVYTYRANKDFDDLTNKIKDKVKEI